MIGWLRLGYILAWRRKDRQAQIGGVCFVCVFSSFCFSLRCLIVIIILLNLPSNPSYAASSRVNSKTDPERKDTVLHICMETLRICSILLQVFGIGLSVGLGCDCLMVG